MKKTILYLFLIFISFVSLGQNATTAIYDNLNKNDPNFYIPPSEANTLFTRESETTTRVSYTLEYKITQAYSLDYVRFAYNSFGYWESPGYIAVDVTLKNLDTDSIYPSTQFNGIQGLNTPGNLISVGDKIFTDITLEPGNYEIRVRLSPSWYLHNDNSSGPLNSNFTRNKRKLKSRRYATAITYQDGSYPIEIYGTKLCPDLDVQLCSSSQNFALGYDLSADITINNVANAEEELSYLWSTGATTAGLTVAPTETQTYTVTVTDKNGCEGTAVHEVIVYDVVYTKEKKDKETDAKKLAKEAEKTAKYLEKGHNEVIMTHKNDHEHKVKAKDVAKKLEDKKGEWTLGTVDMSEVDFSGGDCADEDRYKTEFEDEGIYTEIDELKLNAYPNPVRNTLTLESETKLNGNVKLYDLFGALLDEQVANDVWEVNLDFTHLRKGFYTLVYENNEGARTAKRILKD